MPKLPLHDYSGALQHERLHSRLVPAVLVLGLAGGALPLACGSDSVKNPFGPGAGGAGGQAGAPGSGGFVLVVDGGDEFDPTLGGPCQDDDQCDDDVDCTVDSCDASLGRCRFSPDDGLCGDSTYCSGLARCDVRDGCVRGDVVACSDNDTCTIDACVEETQSCRHYSRDADADGDPVRNCGGHDCDDNDPQVSGMANEVCGNGRDDDCDGAIDEDDCASPEYDSCETALNISKQGYYDLDFTATKLNYANHCTSKEGGYRDAVLLVTLPRGGPWDLDVTGKLDSGRLVLASASTCDEAAESCVPSWSAAGDDAGCTREPDSDATCGSSAPEAYRCDDRASGDALDQARANGCLAGGFVEGATFAYCCPRPLDSVSRLLLRELEPGTYPLHVAADVEATAQIHVEFRPHEPQLGELCEDAVPLVPNGGPVLLRLPGYATDSTSACAPEQGRSGDAFVTFTLDSPQDVTVVAEAQNGFGLPVLSLRDASCTRELTCRRSQPGRLFDRNLAAGTYKVLVAATGLDDVSVRVETAPVSEAPPGEGCDAALPLVAGVEQTVDLSDHEDSVNLGCLVGAPDASFEFELEGQRDVALIGRFSQGDVGGLAFADESCTQALTCSEGVVTERAVRYGVAKGTYRVVIESAQGNPVGVSWFERPARSPVLVPFAEDCDGLVTIPEVGGRFNGNTSNAFPDFDAGCDVGGQGEGGAPDQLLQLTLSTPRRVILDMRGSSYQTMLSVRQGEICPGAELPRACAPGYWSTRSYLDLELQAGTYFVQIDGYAGASGAWKLDVFTAEL